MKIRMGDFVITGPLNEIRPLFHQLSIRDMETLERVDSRLKETLRDLEDIELKMQALTKIVQNLDETVINQLIDAMK